MPTPLTSDYLEDYKAALEEMKRTENQSYLLDVRDRHILGVMADVQDWMKGHIQLFEGELLDASGKARSPSAEQLLAKSTAALAEADRYRFLLTNLLEALKRGESAAEIIERYNDIGLTAIAVPADRLTSARSGVMPVPKPLPVFPYKPASAIGFVIYSLGRFCVSLIKMAVGLAKAISDHVKIKFKPVTGVSGLFPHLSFEVEWPWEWELHAEVKISEAYEAIGAIFSYHAPPSPSETLYPNRGRN
jgi:hypothetical protein